jgi:menaquinol-cytochrome c reductase iron-sulfur subunit
VASPLEAGPSGGVLARLTTVDALVAGGPPQAFKVVADKRDGWTTYKDLPLGLVYVQRQQDGELLVFSASCPHAGCAVEYRKEEARAGHFFCPCHESSFNLDGTLAPDNTQAQRGLDILEVDQERLATGEVWIRFQKFKAGGPEKIAIS